MMKSEILRILRSQEGYVSGQSLCRQMKVSRTAVWKAINQLKDDGYGIRAVNNKGYYIETYPDVMNETELMSLMPADALFRHIHYYETVGSTNDEVKMLAEQGAPEGTVVIAGQQSSGKGRRGRAWSSPAGQNIYMSFLLRPQFEPSSASMLTLVAALAVREALEKQGLSPSIKWPNDIILSGKKVCGILTEMSTQMSWINYIVTGIGINVWQTDFPEDIRAVATSAVLEKKADYRRGQIAADVLMSFEKYFRQFEKTCDLSLLKAEYDRHLANKDKEIRMTDMKGTRQGIARGIDAQGCLIAEIDGRTEHIMSGEVSVRGVLGYV